MGSTYLTVKMVVCTSLLMLIALMNGVQTEDPLVADSSGDGESPDLKNPVSLIDDNGDIHIPDVVDPATNVSEKSEAGLVENSSPKTSNESTLTTMIGNVTEEIPESTTTTSTVTPTETTVEITTLRSETDPPTESTTETTELDTTTTTVMLETTTITTTILTTMPTSAEEEVTTEAEMETSTVVEATVQKKMDKSTESVLRQSTTESTVLTPGAERTPCTFVEKDFVCREQLMCYGEGEVDCTDYDDEDLGMEPDAVKQVSTYTSKSNVMVKTDERPLSDADASANVGNVKSSAKSEDYAEYDADESDAIETFPPNLIGVASRKRIPFILRPFASTEESPNATDEVTTTETTYETEPTSTTTTVQPEVKESMDSATTILGFSASENTEGSEVGQGVDSQATTAAAELAPATTELSENSINLTSADTLINEDDFAPDNGNDTVENGENVEITTGSDETLYSAAPLSKILTKERHSVFRLTRRKRQEFPLETNSSSPQPQSFQVAALESTQRKLRVKVCRLSGDIICTPVATVHMCKGKSYCQVANLNERDFLKREVERKIVEQVATSTADTTESATTRGVETWAVIVIVVCALSGFLTICLLIYLVVTSCKKLKVQPSMEVTTLNYINRGASTNEVA